MRDLNTQELILKGAKKKFHDLGINQVTMQIISEETGISRRTLYRYYKSKEDIAYQVMLSYMKIWNDIQKKQFEDLDGLAIDQLKTYLLRLTACMDTEHQMIKFMADFDAYFRDSKEFSVDDGLDQDIISSYHDSDQLLLTLLRQGIKDGSVRQDFDCNLYLSTVTQSLWVFAQSIALRGKHIKKDTGMDGLDMLRYQVDLYINSIRK